MTIDAPLTTYEGDVEPAWIDLNDHMNVAYYVLAFDYGTDGLYDFVGVGPDYMAATNCSMFALETHVNYLGELRLGERFRITTQLLGFDDKRLQYFSRMHHAEKGFLAATTELLSIHVDLSVRRAAPFPAKIAAWLEAIRAAHADLPRPDEVGSVIALKRPKTG